MIDDDIECVWVYWEKNADYIRSDPDSVFLGRILSRVTDTRIRNPGLRTGSYSYTNLSASFAEYKRKKYFSLICDNFTSTKIDDVNE